MSLARTTDAPSGRAQLDPASIAWVSELVRREASIVLDGKEYLIDSRLGTLARKLGLPGSAAVVDAARSGDAKVVAGIVDALTTNETSFFRDGGPFEALRGAVLPELIRSRASERKIRIWSAACSSGQEAYSVAMVCREVLPAGWSVEILGTDVSRHILDRAKAGRYSQLEVNRGLPAPLLVQWMRRAGTEWEVVPELRSMVRWEWLNLTKPFPQMGRFDIVLLRNVLIYFDAPTKSGVLDRARGVLRPDGFLMLGGAETTIGLGDAWRREAHGTSAVWRLSTHPAGAGAGAGAGAARPAGPGSRPVGGGPGAPRQAPTSPTTPAPLRPGAPAPRPGVTAPRQSPPPTMPTPRRGGR